MTINHLDTFNQWQPAGFDGQFHWEFIKGAFGPNIMPTDVDGEVECNGYFFAFETKSDESIVLPNGQRRSIEAKVKTGYWTVMILYGKTAETITAYEMLSEENGEIVRRLVKPATSEMVWEECAKWYVETWKRSPAVSSYQLRAEIDRLLAGNARFCTENDRLLAENDRFCTDHDRLLAENDRLRKELCLYKNREFQALLRKAA